MSRRALFVGVTLAACSVYEPSLLVSERRAAGGRPSASGGEDSGQAGDGSSSGGVANGGTSSGGAATGGRVASGGGGGDADAGEGSSGAPETGGAGPASGGASSGGISAGGVVAGGSASGGVLTGGAATGGTASGGTGGSGGTSGASKGGSGGSGGTTGGQASGGSAGTAGGGVLFTDNFEAGAATAWTAVTSGDWAVISDGSFAYRQGTVVNTLRVASAGNTAWTNQSVQARIRITAFGGTSASSSYFAALFARYTDEDNHYYVALRSDGKISIRRKIAGSNSSIGSAITPGALITTGTWYTVKLEVVGTSLSAYIDGVLYDTVTDSSFPSGKVAVGSSNASVVFDDVVVRLP